MAVTAVSIYAQKLMDNRKPYEEVTQFMRSEGLYYGYAEFWDADRLAVITDGELFF